MFKDVIALCPSAVRPRYKRDIGLSVSPHGHGDGRQSCRLRSRVIGICPATRSNGQAARSRLSDDRSSPDLSNCEVGSGMLPDDAPFAKSYSGANSRPRRRDGPDAAPFILSDEHYLATSTAAHLASEHARCGQGYVAAPVFGNPDAAGRASSHRRRRRSSRCRALPALIDNLGQQMFVIGTDPAHANLVKLIGNMLTATTLEMLGRSGC